MGNDTFPFVPATHPSVKNGQPYCTLAHNADFADVACHLSTYSLASRPANASQSTTEQCFSSAQTSSNLRQGISLTDTSKARFVNDTLTRRDGAEEDNESALIVRQTSVNRNTDEVGNGDPHQDGWHYQMTVSRDSLPIVRSPTSDLRRSTNFSRRSRKTSIAERQHVLSHTHRPRPPLGASSPRSPRSGGSLLASMSANRTRQVVVLRVMPSWARGLRLAQHRLHHVHRPELADRLLQIWLRYKECGLAFRAQFPEQRSAGTWSLWLLLRHQHLSFTEPGIL